jgi:replication factor A1
MSVNPDIVDAHALRGWYDSVGMDSTFQSHTSTGGPGPSGSAGKGNEVMLIGQVKDRQMGQNDKAEYFTTRATTMHIKPDGLSYPACPSDGCNKKVTESGDDWRCEKCDKTYSKPEHRFASFSFTTSHL